MKIEVIKMANGEIINSTKPSGVGRFISKENLSAYLSEVSMDDIPWAVNFLVSKLVLANNEQKASEEKSMHGAIINYHQRWRLFHRLSEKCFHMTTTRHWQKS